MLKIKITLITSFLLVLLTFSTKAQNQGESLRQETKLDQVYSTYNLSGDGVIVALIERGIDYKHPDFIDANGDTRIAYIFDMIDQTGANAPGNTYGVGTIYNRTEIDQALSSGNQLTVMDRFGHGTACMGIAAGDGSAMPGAPYRGVADGATIIAVEATNDGFPAINGIAGQAGFYDPAYLEIALQFVKDKAIELGLPSVTLMNLGSTGGPTDGTSSISEAIVDFVGPGRLFVCGVGDDGGGDNHAEGTVAQGASVDIMINKTEPGNLRFECWYEGADRFDVTVLSPGGGMTGPYTSPATNQISDQKFVTGINYYHNGADLDFSSSSNGKRQIMIDLLSGTGTFTVRLAGATVSDGAFKASLNPALYSNNNGFSNFVVAGSSINDFASSKKAIVPTDYVWDNAYVDVNGTPRSRTGEGAMGDIWAGSSEGPTYDGRLGVDVAAPGEVLVGAYSDDTYYSQFDFNIIENSGGAYGIQTAVSAAAPVVTGVLALMLEVNPNLTVTQAKDLLHTSARTDAFTGAVPNRTWGYGKLDALAAIEETQKTVSIDRSFTHMDFHFYPNPTSNRIHYQWHSASTEQATLDLIDLQGRSLANFVIQSETGTFELPAVAPGVYILKLESGGDVGVERLIVTGW